MARGFLRPRDIRLATLLLPGPFSNLGRQLDLEREFNRGAGASFEAGNNRAVLKNDTRGWETVPGTETSFLSFSLSFGRDTIYGTDKEERCLCD